MPGAEPGRVHVIGNCMADIRLELPHLPRPGETMLGGGDGRRAPGGKAVNQAVAAARAGARVHLCAPLGNDAVGAEMRRALEMAGLDALQAPECPFPNDFALLLVTPDGENATVGSASCAHALPPEVAVRAAAAARPGDLLVLQGNLTHATTLAVASAAPPGSVVFNPSPIVWDASAVLARSFAVVANEGEARTLTHETDPARAAAALAVRGCGLVVVTAGARGCHVAEGGAPPRHYPAHPAAALDTSGCGDVFCGVLVAGLAAGLPVPRAVDRAQAAAALAATRPGAFTSIPAAGEMPA